MQVAEDDGIATQCPSSLSLSSTSAYCLSRGNKQLGQRKPNGAIRRTDYVRKPAKRKDIRAIDKRINRRE